MSMFIRHLIRIASAQVERDGLASFDIIARLIDLGVDVEALNLV